LVIHGVEAGMVETFPLVAVLVVTNLTSKIDFPDLPFPTCLSQPMSAIRGETFLDLQALTPFVAKLNQRRGNAMGLAGLHPQPLGND
jgi:hypothetical protein